MDTIATPLGVGVKGSTSGTIPRNIGKAMDTCNLEV